MARYSVDVSEDMSVSIDTGPGALPLDHLELSWKVRTPGELLRAVVDLGFDATEMNVTKDLHVRYGLPVTQDGEEVAHCSINLWLGEELTGRTGTPPIPALAAIADAAKQEKTRAEMERAMQAQVDWANEHGRDVALVGGKIVSALEPGARVDEPRDPYAEPH